MSIIIILIETILIIYFIYRYIIFVETKRRFPIEKGYFNSKLKYHNAFIIEDLETSKFYQSYKKWTDDIFNAHFFFDELEMQNTIKAIKINEGKDGLEGVSVKDKGLKIYKKFGFHFITDFRTTIIGIYIDLRRELGVYTKEIDYSTIKAKAKISGTDKFDLKIGEKIVIEKIYDKLIKQITHKTSLIVKRLKRLKRGILESQRY